MARENHRTSSRLYRLGGIHEEPGAATAELGHDDSRGVPREGRALLQGIVYCGVCGWKMSVQNRSVKESRSPSYICTHGYQNGEEKTCQCMTSRPIDAAVVQAFLAAISPVNIQVATRVMDQIEQELVSQRRQ